MYRLFIGQNSSKKNYPCPCPSFKNTDYGKLFKGLKLYCILHGTTDTHSFCTLIAAIWIPLFYIICIWGDKNGFRKTHLPFRPLIMAPCFLHFLQNTPASKQATFLKVVALPRKTFRLHEFTSTFFLAVYTRDLCFFSRLTIVCDITSEHSCSVIVHILSNCEIIYH